MAMNRRLEWKVNTPGLLKEVLQNPGTSVLHKPLQILANLLAEVATEAQRIDDPKLHALMLRLALYEQGDPYSKDYDPRWVQDYLDNVERDNKKT